MAHFHDRHAGAMPVEHFLARLLEYFLGNTAGPGLKL